MAFIPIHTVHSAAYGTRVSLQAPMLLVPMTPNSHGQRCCLLFHVGGRALSVNIRVDIDGDPPVLFSAMEHHAKWYPTVVWKTAIGCEWIFKKHIVLLSWTVLEVTLIRGEMRSKKRHIWLQKNMSDNMELISGPFLVSRGLLYLERKWPSLYPSDGTYISWMYVGSKRWSRCRGLYGSPGRHRDAQRKFDVQESGTGELGQYELFYRPKSPARQRSQAHGARTLLVRSGFESLHTFEK